MKKARRTPWYPVSIKPVPVRKGRYECKSFQWSGVRVRVWSGRRWRHENGNPSIFASLPGAQWRGLTKEHK